MRGQEVPINVSAMVYDNSDLKHDDPVYRVLLHHDIPAQQLEQPDSVSRIPPACTLPIFFHFYFLMMVASIT